MHEGRTLTLPELTRYCMDAGVMRQKIPEQLEVVDVWLGSGGVHDSS